MFAKVARKSKGSGASPALQNPHRRFCHVLRYTLWIDMTARERTSMTSLTARRATLPSVVFGIAFALLPCPGTAADYVELNDFQLIDATGAAARHVDRLIACDGVIVAIDHAGTVPTPEPDAQWTRIGLKTISPTAACVS